jgi:hypothetical protein
MYNYAFPEPWYSGKFMDGRQITACASKIPNAGIRTEIRLVAPNKETQFVRTTRYKGDKLDSGGWALSDFIDICVEEPGFTSTFDSGAVDFKKIDCIKAVRCVTGYGLKEAKEFVESMGVLNALITVVDFQSHINRW